MELAGELGAGERTLRRAVVDGTIRCERLGARRRRVSEEERRSAVGHWPLLAQLRGALRTERNVRLAVVYGSVARGEDTAGSDVDVLVSLAEDRPDAAVKLAVRLEGALGRRVDVARMERLRSTAPLLQQARTLTELYRTRNGLQHSSAGMAADEVHRQVRLLLRHLPRLVASYVAWLERRGIEL